jgi:hypothetical protein
MAHLHVNDDLDRRLRAARPATAVVDEHAHDAELLAAVRRQPVAARRTVPRAVAVPVAAGAAFTAAAVVTLGSGPGGTGGPSSAAAVTQALRWLTPPAGTILHVRSVETQGGRTTTRELWESADDPLTERQAVGEDGARYEVAGDALYDPAANTIYAPLPGAPGYGADPQERSAPDRGAKPGKGAAPGKGVAPGKVDPGDAARSIVGDDVVRKVRTLLSAGHMDVSGPVDHDGAQAYVVSLKQDAGRPVWRLWVSATDGKPLELRDPGRDASEAPQVIRWPAYEVLPEAGRQGLLTLTGAHPSAAVVHDAAQIEAARQRLLPDTP